MPRPALSSLERGVEFVMPELVLLPILGVFGALVAATVVAYLLLNNENLHTRNKH